MTDKYIYILLMHTGTILDRIIRAATRYPYSHVVVSLNDSYEKFYSFGRKKIHRIFYGGMVSYGMNGQFFQVFKNTKVRCYRLKVTRKQYDKLKSVLHGYEKNAEIYKYDVKGLFVRFFGREEYRRDKYYVCSMFVADTLKKAKIYEFDKPVGAIKPKDFEAIPGIELIYEGKLNKIKE